MVEQDHAVGHHEWVVIGKAGYAGAKPDVAGALSGRRHEHLRRRDGLPARAVMLADIGFVIAQSVQPLKKLQVPFQGQCGVLAHPVEGSHEDAEFHAIGDCHAYILRGCSTTSLEAGLF